jgi:hypothetical protein
MVESSGPSTLTKSSPTHWNVVWLRHTTGMRMCAYAICRISDRGQRYIARAPGYEASRRGTMNQGSIHGELLKQFKPYLNVSFVSTLWLSRPIITGLVRTWACLAKLCCVINIYKIQCKCPSEILQKLCESLAVPPDITTLRVNTQRSKTEDAIEAISKILIRVRNNSSL